MPTQSSSVLSAFSFSRLADIQWLMSVMHCSSLTVVCAVSSVRLSTTSAAERADRRQIPVPRPAPLYDFNRATSTDEYVQLFNSKMRRILDLHAPLETRTRRAGRNDCRWLSVEARDAKRSCRGLERRYC